MYGLAHTCTAKRGTRNVAQRPAYGVWASALQALRSLLLPVAPAAVLRLGSGALSVDVAGADAAGAWFRDPNKSETGGKKTHFEERAIASDRKC